MIGLELMSRASPGAGGEPVATPLAGFFVPGGGRSVAIAEGAGGSISVWTEISQNHAAWMRLDGVDATSRWSWRETLIAELRNIYPVGGLNPIWVVVSVTIFGFWPIWQLYWQSCRQHHFNNSDGLCYGWPYRSL